jgi:hypothetical protein
LARPSRLKSKSNGRTRKAAARTNPRTPASKRIRASRQQSEVGRLNVPPVIPRADVELERSVDYRRLRAPSRDDLEGGGFATRQYAGVLVIGANWELASEWLVRERDTLAGIAAQAADEHEFDELANEEVVDLMDPDEGPVAAPDLGMFAACLALCAAGCATAASCRGHPGAHAWSKYPVILVTADRRRGRVLEELARKAGCGLASTDDGRLNLWAQSLEEVLRFAELLIEHRERFDALPLSAALREARGEDPPPAARRPRRPPPGQSTLF